MTSFFDDPLYHVTANFLLRRAARQGTAEARAVMGNTDMLEFFQSALPQTLGVLVPADDPTPAPDPAPTPTPTPSPHPIRDAIAALIAKAVANPQAVIALILQIIALFPKG